MQCAKQHDAHVHPEVENLEQLRVRERKHDDTTELRQSDSTQHLRSSRHTCNALKVGFHYPSSRAKLTARELGCIFWPDARVYGPCTRASGFHYPSWRVSKSAPEFSGRQLGPWTRVVETDLNSHYCFQELRGWGLWCLTLELRSYSSRNYYRLDNTPNQCTSLLHKQPYALCYEKQDNNNSRITVIILIILFLISMIKSITLKVTLDSVFSDSDSARFWWSMVQHLTELGAISMWTVTSLLQQTSLKWLEPTFIVS